MHLRRPGRLRLAGVDDDRARRVGPVQPVELVHPQHRLRLGGVDPDVQDRVAILDVVEARGLTVTPERLLQRLARRRRAEARVAVEVVRADTAPRDESKRVVVLDEQLAARIEPERTTPLRREQLARTLHDADPSPRPSSPHGAPRRGARADAAACPPHYWPASRKGPSGRADHGSPGRSHFRAPRRSDRRERRSRGRSHGNRARRPTAPIAPRHRPHARQPAQATRPHADTASAHPTGLRSSPQPSMPLGLQLETPLHGVPVCRHRQTDNGCDTPESASLKARATTDVGRRC